MKGIKGVNESTAKLEDSLGGATRPIHEIRVRRVGR